MGGVSERPTHEDGESDLFSAACGCNDGERHPVLQDGGTLRGVPKEWRAWPVRHVGRSSSLAVGRTGDIGCPLDTLQEGNDVSERTKQALAPNKRGMICLSCLRDASFAGSRDTCTQIITQPWWGYPSGVMRSKQHRGRANP